MGRSYRIDLHYYDEIDTVFYRGSRWAAQMFARTRNRKLFNGEAGMKVTRVFTTKHSGG